MPVTAARTIVSVPMGSGLVKGACRIGPWRGGVDCWVVVVAGSEE